MIRFGPSGIPLSCKGRTLRDGIEDIHNLGLTAMEVQLVRVNLNERYAGDEDLGRTPREIPGELIVQIGRKEDRKEVLVSSLDEKIEKGDVLYSLASGIAGTTTNSRNSAHSLGSSTSSSRCTRRTTWTSPTRMAFRRRASRASSGAASSRRRWALQSS